jgi:small subunit ribosomal protein S4e
VKKHLKRLPAPRSWKISRKEYVWAYKPRPGPHRGDAAIPLAMALRDLLHVAGNAREAERLVFSRSVQVDGRTVTDPKFPVGLMDVLTLAATKESFRMIIDRRGKLTLLPIESGEAAWKLCRVRGKSTVRGGKFQVQLHDGRTILLPKSEYATGTTLKVALPVQKVIAALPLSEGNIAILTGGQHVGELVHVARVEKTRNPRANVVHFQEGFSTIFDYVFVVGAQAPEIRVPEGKAV